MSEHFGWVEAKSVNSESVDPRRSSAVTWDKSVGQARRSLVSAALTAAAVAVESVAVVEFAVVADVESAAAAVAVVEFAVAAVVVVSAAVVVV